MDLPQEIEIGVGDGHYCAESPKSLLFVATHALLPTNPSPAMEDVF